MWLFGIHNLVQFCLYTVHMAWYFMVNKPHYSTALVIHESGQEVPQWMLKLDKPLKKQKKMLATKQPDRGHLSQAVLHEELERKKKRLGNFLSVFLTTLCFIELNIILVRFIAFIV